MLESEKAKKFTLSQEKSKGRMRTDNKDLLKKEKRERSCSDLSPELEQDI